MKYIISEKQLNLIREQSMTGWANYVPQEKHKEVAKSWNESLSSHEVNTFLGIASVLLPVIGPIVSSLIGTADAAKHYQEGNKKTAAIIAAFSLIPLSARLLGLIPEISQIGTRGSAAIAEKLLSNSKLAPVQSQIIKKMVTNKSVVEAELKSIGALLKPVEPSITKYKSRYVQKYGEQKYMDLFSKYISKQITTDQFNKTIAAV